MHLTLIEGCQGTDCSKSSWNEGKNMSKVIWESIGYWLMLLPLITKTITAPYIRTFSVRSGLGKMTNNGVSLKRSDVKNGIKCKYDNDKSN